MPRAVCILLADHIDAWHVLAILQARTLIGCEWSSYGVEGECSNVIDACIQRFARLGVAGDIVVRPHHVARLPDALGVRRLVLVGKVEVVIAVGKERLVVTVHHHDHGAVELAQLVQKVGERFIRGIHKGAILVCPRDDLILDAVEV